MPVISESDYLEHVGVKGMKWGKRKRRGVKDKLGDIGSLKDEENPWGRIGESINDALPKVPSNVRTNKPSLPEVRRRGVKNRVGSISSPLKRVARSKAYGKNFVSSMIKRMGASIRIRNSK